MDEERQPLTRSRVIAAATELIDREGLTALTMDALGDRLDVTDMAIYRHVRSKGELLDLVLDELLARVPAPPKKGIWEERLLSFYGGLWALLRSHPMVLPLTCSRAASAPALRACAAQAETLLVEGGFTAEQARQALLTLTAYVIGVAGLTLGPCLDDATRLTEIDWQAADRQFGEGLAAVLAGVKAQLG